MGAGQLDRRRRPRTGPLGLRRPPLRPVAQRPGLPRARSIEAYGTYYEIAYPNRELARPRGQRTSALYDRLAARGACFGTKFGWERANWFGADPVETPTFGRSDAFDAIAAEHHAVRTAVGVVDQSSFAKYEITGPGALPLLQKVAGANLDVRVGRVVYTQLLNARGGIEADVTITRLGEHEFYLVTGSAFGRHDLTFLLQHAPDDGSVQIRDVTSAFGVLNVCGPRSRELLAALTWADLGNDAFRYMTAQQIDVGSAPVRALRVTYVGELGWELHVPSEYVRGVYDDLLAAGDRPRPARRRLPGRRVAAAGEAVPRLGASTSGRTTTRTRPAWPSRCAPTSPSCSPAPRCAGSGTPAPTRTAVLVRRRRRRRHARRRAAHPRPVPLARDRAQRRLRSHRRPHDLLRLRPGRARRREQDFVVEIAGERYPARRESRADVRPHRPADQRC